MEKRYVKSKIFVGQFLHRLNILGKISKGLVIFNAGFWGGVSQEEVPIYFATSSWGPKNIFLDNQGIVINFYIACSPEFEKSRVCRIIP